MSAVPLLSTALMCHKMHGVDGGSATTISEIMHEELVTPGDVFLHLNFYFYFHS